MNLIRHPAEGGPCSHEDADAEQGFGAGDGSAQADLGVIEEEVLPRRLRCNSSSSWRKASLPQPKGWAPAAGSQLAAVSRHGSGRAVPEDASRSRGRGLQQASRPHVPPGVGLRGTAVSTSVSWSQIQILYRESSLQLTSVQTPTLSVSAQNSVHFLGKCPYVIAPLTGPAVRSAHLWGKTSVSFLPVSAYPISLSPHPSLCLCLFSAFKGSSFSSRIQSLSIHGRVPVLFPPIASSVTLGR